MGWGEKGAVRDGLIFQECHYELADIKFVPVGLPVVTVETPLHPRVQLFVALGSLLVQQVRARLFNECRPRRGRRLNSDQ